MNGGISIEFTLNKLHFSTSFLMVVGFFLILVVDLEHFAMQRNSINPLKDFGV